jgi:catechol 2,3-dioxygenase-like lactoylglutathione lyase family enzyme
MFKLEQVDHLALTVADVSRSVAWYHNILGLQRRHEEVWGDSPAVMYAGPNAIALFAAGGPLEPAPETGTAAVMRHFAFSADGANFERARNDLRERGIQFSQEDHGISRSIYLTDPDGYLVEITTYDLAR